MHSWWLTLWRFEPLIVPWSVVTAVTLLAAVCDIRTRRIPNLLTGCLFLSGIVFAAVVGGPRGVCDAIGGAAIAMLPFVITYAFADGGAGDAKLMAGVGAWLGVVGGVLAMAMVLVAGGVIAVIHMLALRRTSQVLANLYLLLWRTRLAVHGRHEQAANFDIPHARLHAMLYGSAIFVGTAIATGVVLTWRGL